MKCIISQIIFSHWESRHLRLGISFGIGADIDFGIGKKLFLPFEFWKVSMLVFRKNSYPEKLWKISSKESMKESFLAHSHAFQEISVVLSSYSVGNLVAPNSVKRNSTAGVISAIFRDFKITQSWRLQFLGLQLLKRNSIIAIFLETFNF